MVSPYNIPPDTKALIFDMDGTLIDSKHLHMSAWRSLMKEEKKDFTEKHYNSLNGMTSEGFVQNINKMFGTDLKTQKTIEKKDVYYLQSLNKISLHQSILDIVYKYYKKIPLALGTNENRPVTKQILKNFEIYHLFSAVVTADDVEKPKPNPALFLECAKRMGVSSKHCHVFEDSPVGIEAAKKAGMSVTDVTNIL